MAVKKTQPKEEMKVPQEESKFDKKPLTKKSVLRPEDSQIWHGSLGNPEWPAPKCTFKSDEKARKGSETYVTMTKSEFRERK